jgi:subtilisin family serine protease
VASQGRRLVDLLRRRPGIRGSAAREDGTVHLFRPGEILVAAEHLAEALDRLRDLGARPEAGQRLEGNLVVVRVPVDQTEALASQLCSRLPPGSCSLRHYQEGALPGPWEPPTPTERRPPAPEDPSAGRGVHILMLDSGAPRQLPDGFPGTLIWAREDEEAEATNFEGHGLFLASVAGQLAPAAVIELWRVLDRDGLVDEIALGQRLEQGLRRGPDLVLLGLGGYTWNDQAPLGLRRPAETPTETVVMAAAGNDGSERPYWPAALEWVVSVGAMTEPHQPAPFSNRGSSVDLWAPGAGVVGYLADGPAAGSGTSVAAAFLVGAVAARMSTDGSSAREALSRLEEAYLLSEP